MNALAVVDKGADWRRLKALVLESVYSPITLGTPRSHGRDFTKATLAAWRAAQAARGRGAVSVKLFAYSSDYRHTIAVVIAFMDLVIVFWSTAAEREEDYAGERNSRWYPRWKS